MHTNYRSYGAAIKTASPGEIIDCIRSIDGATRQPTAACTTRNTSKIDWVFFFLFCFVSLLLQLCRASRLCARRTHSETRRRKA